MADVGDSLAAVRARLGPLGPQQHKPVSSRCAAVLVGLFEDASGCVRVLLTQRSSHLSSHRGEVCLPGGKRDPGDVDDVATALREAHEELGLEPSSVQVLCCLPPLLSKHFLSVTPVIGIIPSTFVPRPNPDEVAAAFTVPLGVFLGDEPLPLAAAAALVGASAGAGAGSSPGASSKGQPALPGQQPLQQQQQPQQQEQGGLPEQPPAKRPQRAAAAAARGRWQSTAAGDAAGPQGSGSSARSTADPGASSPPAAAGAAATAEDGHAMACPGGLWRPLCSNGGCGGCDAAAAANASVSTDAAAVPARHTWRDIAWEGHRYRIHSFLYKGFDVWGLTATILITAARAALGRPPSFQEHCPKGLHYTSFFHDGQALRIHTSAAPVEGGSTELDPQQQQVADGDVESVTAAEVAAVTGPEPACGVNDEGDGGRGNGDAPGDA